MSQEIKPQKAIVLLSGGLDSATVAAQAIADGYEVIALSFSYGQRHRKELTSARLVAEDLGISEHLQIEVNLSLWGGSALTDQDIAIPNQGIALQNLGNQIPNTYVPGRNTVFIAIALSLAEAKSAKVIYLGINAVDYSGYPDCRPEYLAAWRNLSALSSKVALEGEPIQLIAPLIYDSKTDIVHRAIKLGVPIAKTWSCYLGEAKPCGVCDSCRIRDRALIEAGYGELATVNLSL